MDKQTIRQQIEAGNISVGIELGSTRIKTVAIDSTTRTIATGHYEWEQQLTDGYWSYDLDEVWQGIQESFRLMTREIKATYEVKLTHMASLGISGMMHGYLVFDAQGQLLVPFRTWRNNTAHEAGKQLREAFQFNIPERWSIAHYYQSALKEESHVKDVAYMTTLSGYVHWQLTGEKVLGIGDASGMFPIDPKTATYRKDLCEQFDTLMATNGYDQDIQRILPTVHVAGEQVGTLTADGARLLDPTGTLTSGCPMCAPEGDAGTGMVATNSIAPKTGNVSAGTSIFAMIVLEQPLQAVYPEVDIVTTPAGDEVAMIHANNGSSDLNHWVHLFEEVFQLMDMSYDKTTLWTRLFESALDGDDDLGKLLSYGYISGEYMTDVPRGFPLFIRQQDSRFNIQNFMKNHIFTMLSTLKIGVDRLKTREQLQIDRMTGHGGVFATKQVVQRYLAAALESPVTVMENANEGGAWGMAMLARYMLENNGTLAAFLEHVGFRDVETETMAPQARDIESFNTYVQRFEAGLAIERLLNDMLD
ncbi:TPA: ATPase [Staphylococcus pseudintermedius]|nr:ATPase [Staphylococcus pseudintermedius]EGQ3755622.1 ATPase [Staphylococcus pseudintermedius]EJD5743536.1 ATPase [Staphylococcus pseudintermedius]MDK3911720.1 FGGY-family carbohydrate kinase [Staphylococcus pseudintermedius]MDK3986923.1 FGGY-family carbohydrate kinase [Staphylococcus pseudintermedius]